MRHITTFLAITAVVTQLVAPAFAGDIFEGGMFNHTTALGWRQTTGPAAMAYFRVPFTATSRGTQPQLGLMVAGPQAYWGGESHLHLDGPRVLDVSLTGRNLAAPWRADSWTTTMTVGNAVAWSSDRQAPAPGEAPHLFESGLSWVAIGVLTVGAVAGTFVLIDRQH